MNQKPTIVAVNGSPHAGNGSTSLMMEMLRPTLAQEGFELEAIHLSLTSATARDAAFVWKKGSVGSMTTIGESQRNSWLPGESFWLHRSIFLV